MSGLRGAAAEGHGAEAFGRGTGKLYSGELVLADSIWAGADGRLFPYNERYGRARITDVYLIELQTDGRLPGSGTVHALLFTAAIGLLPLPGIITRETKRSDPLFQKPGD